MDVPIALLEKWNALKSRGDSIKIIAKMPADKKVSDETIRLVFKRGRCSDEVFLVMAAYYEEKEKLFGQYIKY